MLIKFAIENWEAFRDETTLNLIGTLERQHGETLAKMQGHRSLKILPTASVYGGNASGKTSLFEALDFLRDLVVRGRDVDEDVAPYPFMLDEDSRLKPTVMDIMFSVSDTVYHYLLELERTRLASESLTIVRDRGRVDVLYMRHIGDTQGSFFNEDFFRDIDRVRFVSEGTRENQPFLTNAVSQNVHELDAAYRWFRDSLRLIGVGNEVTSFAHYYANPDFLAYASEVLWSLDTGVRKIDGEVVDIDSVPVPDRLIKGIPEGDSDTVFIGSFSRKQDYDFDMYVVETRSGQRRAKHIRSYHEFSDGSMAPFDLSQESSGTKRLIGLIPMMYDLSKTVSKERVYVIDELDRCFHTMLTKRIVELFLESCDKNTRKQLLFTTHDLFLMDQSLLRRDEMYISEREYDGTASLTGLNEFAGIRFDKDLIRSYMEGRFGGIPMFSHGGVHHG